MTALVGIAFWFFIASVVVASLWFINTQAKEAQKTIRLAIEKGVPIETIRGKKQENDIIGFFIGGIITTAVGAGMPIMGYFFGLSNPKAFLPLAGIGILVLFVGIGLLLCGWFISRRKKNKTQDQ